MKERGILFTPPNVADVASDYKTQTRRMMAIQPEPDEVDNPYWQYLDNGQQWTNEPRDMPDECTGNERGEWMEGDKEWRWRKCPYGQKGDRLWVREAHYSYGYWIRAAEDDKREFAFVPTSAEVRYREDVPVKVKTDKGLGSGWVKRSPLFMFRKDVRLLLEIVDIRVERLQDISSTDCIAEGVREYKVFDENNNYVGQGFSTYADGHCKGKHQTAQAAYAHLWDSINGKTHPWKDNDWVWVVEFKRVEPTAAPQR